MPVGDSNTTLSADEQRMFSAALSAPIPRLYLNGFILAQSLNDVAIVTQTNGAPTSVLNMSFTSAKSLSLELDALVKNFEQAMSHEILTMKDIQNKMVKGDKS